LFIIKRGKVDLDELSLEIGGSGISGSPVVTLNRIVSETEEDGQVLAQSDTYELVDLPADFDGTLEVEIALSKGVLSALDKNDPDQASRINLMVGADGYGRTAGGEVNVFLPVLNAQVDLQAKTIRGTLDFSKGSQTASISKLAALTPPSQRLRGTHEDVTPNRVRFKVETSLFSWNKTVHQTQKMPYNKKSILTAVISAARVIIGIRIMDRSCTA
jgi:hypothetical protein